jgi:hypothetical protein
MGRGQRTNWTRVPELQILFSGGNGFFEAIEERKISPRLDYHRQITLNDRPTSSAWFNSSPVQK